MNLAGRMNRIGVERAFEVLVRARALEAQGRDIIHLEIGEPDFDTPRHIIDAAKQALDEGWTHYGPTQGMPELREAIAAYILRTRGIRVGPEHVSVVPGGKPIIFFPMLALVEPGDEVIYPNPGFPIYESMINFIGATPVPIPLVEERGFSFDLNLLRDRLSPKTKLLILNSPHNPTGGVIPPEDIRAIADLVRGRDLMVLADEIYSEIYFEQPPLFHRDSSRYARKDHHPGWVLEDLRHDGLADGLRRDASVVGGGDHQADGELELMHGKLYSAGGHRGAHGSAGQHRENGRGISATARCVLRRIEHGPRIPWQHPGWRVLCIPEHHRHGLELGSIGGCTARESWGRLLKRDVVRSVRGGLLAVQYREFLREVDDGGGENRGLLSRG